jgi:hypothetical protein
VVQTLDIPATLLKYFGQDLPPDMQGKSLEEAVANNAKLREAALFGVFGGHVNVSDGHYVYMRAPIDEANAPLYEYTLLPTHMKHPFSVEELQVAPPFSFTKGCPANRIRGKGFMNKAHEFGTLLFDLQTDPQQQNPLRDEAIETRMIELLLKLMQENDAPREQYQRLGLPIPTR